MKNESEINLKRSYWLGALDMLNIPENARSEKLNKEKITAQTWLVALDWVLSQGNETNSEVDILESKK
jgi:hypothetical protein